jgi:uncharacterized protein involved in exopolysaccharide biosynthesis
MSNSQDIKLTEIVFQTERLFKVLLRKWKLLMIVGFTGGVLGFVFASFQNPSYISHLSFMLNDKESGIPTSLSSLAGLAGLSGSGASTNDDRIVFMSTSRNILSKTLLVRETIHGKKDLLINHYIDFNQMVDGFSSDTSLIGFERFVHDVPEKLTYQENKVMDIVIKAFNDNKMLTVSAKKKTGLVTQSAGIVLMEFKSLSEEFSKYFLENLYSQLSTYYINKSIERQMYNYNIIQRRADSIQDELLQVENSGATFVDQNQNVVKMSRRIEGERLRKKIEILNLMYGEVLKNLEIAKFTLENQTPSLIVIDTPTFPLEKKKMSRLKTAIVGAFLLGALGALYVLRKKYLEERKTINQIAQ